MSKGKTKGFMEQTKAKLATTVYATHKSLQKAAIAALPLAVICTGLFNMSSTASCADTYGYGSQATDSSSNRGQKVELDIVNANLLSVVQGIRLQSGAQIVIVGGEKSYQPVTLTVSGSLDDVLRYVAQSAGATVGKDDNGVYTFRPVSSDNSDNTGAYVQPQQAPQPVVQQAPVPAASMHWEKIVLENVDPNFILNMINDSDGYRDSDPFTNPANHISPAQPTDTVAPVMAGPSAVTVNETNNGRTSSEEPSVPMSGNQFGSAGNQANRSNDSRQDQANQFGGFQPGGGQQFNPFGGGGAAQPGGALPGNIGAAGANLRPQGIDAIIANEQDNALIVRGTAEGIAELKQIINFLDRAPKQVQIKVDFITASVADVNNFGISWDLIPAPNIDVGFNGPGIDGTAGSTYLTFAQGNLVARMQAILTRTKGKVISAPEITCTNNTAGTINFSQQIPYQTSTTVAQGSGNAVTGTQVNFLTVQNSLTVTPRINGDNSVSLLLAPILSTPGTPTFSGGPPPVSQQSIRTYRTVANGDTMVLGGLVSKNETNLVEKVPFLSSLPIIGSLFRTRNLNTSDVELLVFVTPTVLPPIGANLATTVGGATPNAASAGPAVGVTP